MLGSDAAGWATIASLATAGGTLVLAIATFASVRSAHRMARVAERSLLIGLRPLLVPTRFGDPMEKVNFADGKWLKVDGGRAGVELGDDAIYFAMGLRNAGQGIAVLDRWAVEPALLRGDTASPVPPERYRRLTRDLLVAPGDQGFWQGAIRDRDDPLWEPMRKVVEEREGFTVELLYSDHEGGQRTITRFAFLPAQDGGWFSSVGRHWNLDRADPR
ncbi:MAG: hypothetical protein ACYDA2_02770 [Acidimicrobiales bacterium]